MFDDPCPPTFHCDAEQRLCVKDVVIPPPDGCVPAEETCNGEDDNCNGFVDEGQDVDGDGYTFCGSQPGTMGNFLAGPPAAEFADCDDSNRNVHPGAPEICDGRFNGCPASGAPDDGATCDGGGLCVGGRCVNPGDCTAFPCSGTQVCDPATLMCVMSSCMPGDCTGGTRCDPGLGTCVPLTPLGGACNVDTECTTGVCIAREALGLPSGSPRGVCGQACCNDGQCNAAAASAVCVQAASGARTCLPGSMVPALGIPVPAARTCQSFFGGLACLGEASDGCLYADETPQEVCSFIALASCYDEAVYNCGLPCDSADVCAANERCQYIQAGNARLGRCGTTSLRRADAGASCGSDDACRDGVCVAGVCGAPCCTDMNCGSGTRCRPYLAGSGFAPMRCQSGINPPI